MKQSIRSYFPSCLNQVPLIALSTHLLSVCDVQNFLLGLNKYSEHFLSRGKLRVGRFEIGRCLSWSTKRREAKHTERETSKMPDRGPFGKHVGLGSMRGSWPRRGIISLALSVEQYPLPCVEPDLFVPSTFTAVLV